VAHPGIKFGMGTCNGGLGAEPPSRSRGRALGGGPGGRSPPEAESLSAFRRPVVAVEVAELPHSAYFAKSINQA